MVGNLSGSNLRVSEIAKRRHFSAAQDKPSSVANLAISVAFSIARMAKDPSWEQFFRYR